MAIYRYQAVSVGMWRGKIKRWNTTFHLSNSTSTTTIHDRMLHTGWKVAGDVSGACSGGLASISIYNATGGAPIAQTVYFDWQTPSTWIPYDGTYWASIDPATPLDASGESAVVVVGQLPGLSKTGKPMTTRKYFHAIPSRTATGYTDPDVPSAVATLLETWWPPSLLMSPSGITPTATVCEEWYGNHQRVRGRRRTTNQVAAQSFSAGVVAGTATGAAGAASPQ